MNQMRPYDIPIKNIDHVTIELADRRKMETNKMVNIKKLELDTYKTTGITAQVIGLQRYDAILGKPWLFHANPNINWRNNTMTFKYGSKTIIVNANSHKTINNSSCHSVFVPRQQLARTSVNAELFALHANEIKPVDKYHPEKINIVADTLSQRIHLDNMELIDTRELERKYKKDTYFGPLLTILKDKDNVKDPKLIARVKYFEYEDNKIYLKEGRRLAIPKDKTLRTKILNKCHDIHSAGHIGIDKTYELVARNYFWPNMSKDVRKYVDTCNGCQRNKIDNQQSSGLLQPLDIPENYCDEWSPALECAYHNSKQASMKLTPFELDLGRHPNTNIKIAKNMLDLTQQRQSPYANKKRKHIAYEVDDQILLPTKNLKTLTDKDRPARKKSTSRFVEPFKISEISELPHNMKMNHVFHVSLLKPYKETDDFTKQIPSLSEIINEEEEYTVEAILDKKIVGKDFYYLVKWLGYPLYDATWKPIQHLQNAQEKVREFENQRGR